MSNELPNKYYMVSEINEESLLDFVQYHDAFLALYGAGTRLDIYLSSGGGCVYSGWAIVEIIENSLLDIHIHATGMVASMGLVIFLSVPLNNRTMGKHTTIMSHQHSTMNGVPERYHETKLNIDHHEWIYNEMRSHFKSKTGLTLKKVDEILLGNGDRYLTPKECIELKITGSIR